MTIAIYVKVNDGVVLAADSRSTLTIFDEKSQQSFHSNSYDNANKVFNLFKGLPIGAVTTGMGAIGNVSIDTLVKDFRRWILKEDDCKKILVERNGYSVEWLVDHFASYILEYHLHPLSERTNKFQGMDKNSTFLMFIIAGYSNNDGDTDPLPEVWSLVFYDGEILSKTKCLDQNGYGIGWGGQGAPLDRLVNGYDPALVNILVDEGIDEEKRNAIIEKCKERLGVSFVNPAMPIIDAIDLADFIVDLTGKYWKFCPCISGVGGPTEIASITKHEHFKWIRRKHYYSEDVNPSQAVRGE